MPADGSKPAKADGRQSRWNRHNEVRRQHIIDAAIDVLSDTAGMLRARGVELDPDRPVEHLLEAALDGAG